MPTTSADPRAAAALAPSSLPPEPPRALVRTWLVAIGGLALAKLVSAVEPTGLLGANLAGVAAFLFIALPDGRIRRRHESWSAYGLPPLALRDARAWRAIGRGTLQGLLVCAVVFPAFAAIFWAYAELVPHVPGAIARVVAPYGVAPRPAFRLPDRVLLLLVVQLLVVAAPEELFYRGWMQTSWRRSAPERGVTVLGARLGSGFLWTQLLFALGHLVVLQPWRLATFLPGLLFGWVRERTGGLVAPVVVHALSNVFLATLEASFYG
ncbi:myxosortase MrtX [Anaeromyxobacter sp. Fw109-5]|uniref:myxosortase MrtX n=1 Tax=Anaeromyxobacter sp. (strain Fw109-5) TaxID=404589 RepID=UPI000158A74D|nr:MXAN_2755 family glutamic-type intramembrane protease [Anaeromyxobacter sp. Fw109-5]ABS25477.1 Abortive infection protein [Anaeromyxobacter sp. Fw109-5]